MKVALLMHLSGRLWATDSELIAVSVSEASHSCVAAGLDKSPLGLALCEGCIAQTLLPGPD